MYFLCFFAYNKGIMNPFIYQVKKNFRKLEKLDAPLAILRKFFFTGGATSLANLLLGHNFGATSLTKWCI